MNVNDRIERLINRRLDGELTEDESLELDRELIRNPQARMLLEQLSRLDKLAGAAIADACSAETIVPAVRACQVRRPASAMQSWWLVPGSLAAGVLLYFGLSLLPVGAPDRAPMSEAVSTGRPSVVVPPSSQTVGYQPVIQSRRFLDREYLGVANEAGDTIYLIEMNRVDQIERRRGTAGAADAVEEL